MIQSDSDVTDAVMSIGTLAEKVGLSVSAVRKYEKEGLLIPYRLRSGHRLFSLEDVARVRYIHHMIQDLGLNSEAIRRMQALLPCWDLLPCNPETGKNCPAYQDNTKPCWTTRGMSCAPQGNECRQCVVYRFGSLCTEEIKSLVHEQADTEDRSAALRELLDRKRRSNKEG